MRNRYLGVLAALYFVVQVCAQALPTDGPLTLRPMLQQLGERLLKGKTGAIVAINPANGEIKGLMCGRLLASRRHLAPPLRRHRH